MATEDDFTAWAKSHGLNDKTVTILKEEDLNDLAELKTLSDDDIDEIPGLSFGMRKKLKTAIEELKFEPNKFIECHKDVECLKSQKAHFTVRVSGNPTPEVEWSRNGAVLLPSVNIKIDVAGDKHVLTIDRCSKDVSGEITATARNGVAPDISCAATLNVIERNVVLCNCETDWQLKKDVTKLQDILEGLCNLKTCMTNEKPSEFLENNLPTCDFGIMVVNEYTSSHAEAVVALSEQWKKPENRKIIPVYSTPEDYEKRSDVPEFLRNAPLFMRTSDSEDFSAFTKTLLDKLWDLSDQRLSTLYPLGDASKGLAINYLKIISTMLGPQFEEKFIDKCKEIESKEAGSRVHPVMKTIIAVPKNWTCNSKLSDCGDEFKEKETITLPKSEMHGLPRDLTMSMYTLRHEGEVYLTRVEVPNIITTLYEMTRLDIPGVEKLSEKQMKEQRNDFVNEITLLLDMHFSDKYLIVWFDDSEKSLAPNVISKILEDKKRKEAKTTDEERKALVLCDFEQHPEEEKRVKLFKEALGKAGVQFYEDNTEQYHKPETDPAGKGVSFNHATVFFWIHNGKLTEMQKYVKQNYLAQQDMNKFKQLVPVIADGTEVLEDRYFEGITGYKYCDPGPGHDSFIQSAIKICTNEIPLTFPLGPVHHGLVWTAALNYFKKVMPCRAERLAEQIKELKESYQDAIYFPKIIVLAEKHCRDAGGTVISITLEFEEATLTDAQKKKVPHCVKEEVAKFLNIDEKNKRLKVAQIEGGSGVPRVRLTLLRKHPKRETYDSSLQALGNILADHAVKNKLKIDLGSGVQIVACKAEVAGKKFEEFDGIQQAAIETIEQENVMAGTTKKTFQGVYKITYQKKDYFATFEFIRALACLGEIKNAGLVPLSMVQMEEECLKFVDLYRKKVQPNIPEIRDSCQLLYFDGDESSNRDDSNELRLNKIIAEFIEEAREKAGLGPQGAAPMATQ